MSSSTVSSSSVRLSAGRSWFRGLRSPLIIALLAFTTSARCQIDTRPDARSKDASKAVSSAPTPQTTAATPTTTLERLSSDISAVAEEAARAVVFLSVSKTIRGPQGTPLGPFDFFFDFPFNFPHNGRLRPEQRAPERRQQGVGSGFFFNLAQGHVLTNNHVIAGADEISVKLANGLTTTAKVVGRDENTDLAVVQITPDDFNRDGLSELSFATESTVRVGEIALAVGAPFGLESSLSLGVVSAAGRGSLGITQLGDFLQTDAAINPGNSGGPLIDVKGRVIGVNTAIYSQTGSSAGIGFAIPARMAQIVAARLIEHGTFNRGYLGVALQALEPELAANLGVPLDANGAVVTSVTPGGPGDRAGLRAGDAIIAVNGRKLTSEVDLVNTIGFQEPGSEVKLSVIRDGKPREVAVKLGTWPKESGAASEAPSPDEPEAREAPFGLSVAPLSDDLRRRLGVDAQNGLVVIGIKAGSEAQRAGLERGDVILEIDRKPVTDVETLRRLGEDKQTHLAYIQRGEARFFTSLRPDVAEGDAVGH